MKNINYTTDVAIIGAGPTGLFAVFECGMVGLKCHVIDALDSIGGQCTALYPEKPIYDIPACPEIMAQDLINQLERQAEPFSPVYHLGQTVISITQHENDFLLTTSKEIIIRAKSIIIAGGAGAFGPHRLPLENIEQYEGKSVFYAVRKKQDFAGKRIVIAGGGDSAVDWALALAETAAHISFVHRRPKFKAAPASVQKLEDLSREGRIDLVIPGQLKALRGHNGQLTHVTVEKENAPDLEIETDCLLPFFGLSTSLGFIATWGLNLDHHTIIVDQAKCQTSIAGIYAIGDIATYPHKLKLILTGFAEAAHAAHAIRRRLYPDAPQHFEYSTTKGVQGFGQ